MAERRQHLSPRETQILSMLAQGFSSKEMSKALNLSIGTVKSYRRSLYEKLKVFKRSAAVAAARDFGATA